VIGPNATVCRLGGYSGVPLNTVSILDGVKARVAGKADVTYAQGCVLVKNEPADAWNRWKIDRVELATDEENRPLIEEARKTAADADVTILVIGETESLCRESWGRGHLGDSTTLELPGSQKLLVDAVMASGKPVVVYLMNGRPLAINDLKTRASAILEGFYEGLETGAAAAAILFGDVAPSGKLTTSFPKSVGQLPAYYAKKPGAARYDYEFADSSPVFPFGFGLSYTTFTYANPRLRDATIHPDGQTVAMIDVTNSGSREADEIVQMYVRDDVSSVTRPLKELKGFKRIHLKPGETRTVELPITTDALAMWDLNMKYRVEPGTFHVTLGPSSASGQTVTLTVAP
jgi:beta-glucosidase